MQAGRNIVIFSDGTGQRGGLLIDERRSNVYKLYRATRSGPDSPIDPTRQFAFYDPGLGTLPAGAGTAPAFARSIYNLASQATGLGLTRNIVDCYAEIVRNWRPGDRIYLIGFSRGAYTVRCLGGVLALCGVPTRMPDGGTLRRDASTARSIAREAVEQVYQHTSTRRIEPDTPTRTRELLAQRSALARRFRSRYGSEDAETAGRSNAVPHFLGVFDTVASLSNPAAVAGLVAVGAAVVALVALVAALVSSPALGLVVVLSTAVAGVLLYLVTHVKVAFGLTGYPWWRTLHLTEARMRFYDRELNPRVHRARHALSIDETRASFERVEWEVPDSAPGKDADWFRQVWFAGVHSDVGGGYPEPESRLSDIALLWMLDAAVDAGLEHDPSILRTWPDPLGPQHDETRRWPFRWATRRHRRVADDAPLHPSVLERLQASAVDQDGREAPYRPSALAHHELAVRTVRQAGTQS